MTAGMKTSIAAAALALAVGTLVHFPFGADAQSAQCWSIAMVAERFHPMLLNQCTGETWILGYAHTGGNDRLPQWNLLPRSQQRQLADGASLTLEDLVRLADDERQRLWYAERFPNLRRGDPVPAWPPPREELRRLHPGERD